MLKRTAIGVLALLLPQVGVAVESEKMSVDDIMECVKRSGPEKSSIQSATLRSVDEKGVVNESEATLYWRKFDDGLSRALIRFSAPPDLRGSALLMLEEANGESDMYMYLPEFRKVRRVTTGMMSGSMFGTDFTYEEFEHLYDLAEKLENRRLEDGRVGDEPVYVVESTPQSEEDSAYSRIVQYVEQARCIPLKSEFFEGSGGPRKVLSVDPSMLRQVSGAWLPHQIVMRDLRDGTQTILVMRNIEVDVDIPERTFSQRSLSRGY